MRNFLFHPVCEMFPIMTGEDFKQFVQSIRDNGLLDPVLIHDGMIADGRIRYLACKEAGVECRFVEWDGRGSLPEIIAARNLPRRHLNADQRAGIALRFMKFVAAEAKKNQLAGLKRGTQIPVLANLPKREETPETRVSGKTRLETWSDLRLLPKGELERRVLKLEPELYSRHELTKAELQDVIVCAIFGPEDGSQTSSLPKPPPVHARDEAAKAVHVSSRKLGDMIVIDREAPHLVAPIIAGEMKSSEAMRQVFNARRHAKLEERVAAAGVAAAGVAAAGVAAPFELVCDESTARLYTEKARTFRLAIADPPYNEGIDYGDGGKADRLPKAKYLAFTRRWIEEVHRTLTNDGVSGSSSATHGPTTRC